MFLYKEMQLLSLLVTLFESHNRTSSYTSQNTMYCGGEPEQRHNMHILIAHKHIAFTITNTGTLI